MENKNKFKQLIRHIVGIFILLFIAKENENRLKRFMRYFIGVFILLFIARLGYGFYTTPNQPITQNSSNINRSISETPFQISKKNYASDSYKYKATAPSSAAMPQMSQKYEKTADLVSGSNNFENDEKEIRIAIEKNNGIIQYENKRGLDGARVLQLLIGVPPSKFDGFYMSLQKIGTIESQNITKTDKTNEFLNLKAQRASLESTLKALVELKSHNGRIEELISLQEKILEIEKKLQELGVMLGEYDEVNEFCSVKLILNENEDIFISPPTIIKRLVIALSWTIKVYIALGVAFFLGLLTIHFILILIEKIMTWTNILKK